VRLDGATIAAGRVGHVTQDLRHAYRASSKR